MPIIAQSTQAMHSKYTAAPSKHTDTTRAIEYFERLVFTGLLAVGVSHITLLPLYLEDDRVVPIKSYLSVPKQHLSIDKNLAYRTFFVIPKQYSYNHLIQSLGCY